MRSMSDSSIRPAALLINTHLARVTMCSVHLGLDLQRHRMKDKRESPSRLTLLCLGGLNDIKIL